MTELDLAALKADYEARVLTLDQLSVRYSTSTTTINAYRKAGNWVPRRAQRAARADILSRVYRILDRQTQRMEEAMDRGEETFGMSDLANVTRTLEKLIALNKAETKRKRNPPDTAVIKALRDKLADRIEQLNQG